MKTSMACSLALGLAAATIGAGADGRDCCKGPGARAAAGCPAGDCKICLDTNGMTVAELARRLSEKIGVEVRVQGPSFETLKLKLCAPTPEAALTQIDGARRASERRRRGHPPDPSRLTADPPPPFPDRGARHRARTREYRHGPCGRGRAAGERGVPAAAARGVGGCLHPGVAAGDPAGD